MALGRNGKGTESPEALGAHSRYSVNFCLIAHRQPPTLCFTGDFRFLANTAGHGTAAEIKALRCWEEEEKEVRTGYGFRIRQSRFKSHLGDLGHDTKTF